MKTRLAAFLRFPVLPLAPTLLALLAALVALLLWTGVRPAHADTPAPAAAPAAGAAFAPPRHGSVTLEPGYRPAADPESSSVRLGRRLGAPLVRKRFAGGAKSLDDLGRRVCRALSYARPDSLLALCVREDEFRDILWREFPQSRPATGIAWGDAWMFLGARLHGGSVSAAQDYGGRHYDFVRFDRYDSTQVFRNFKLHKGLVLWARDGQGQLQRFTWFRAAVERKGSFKIYSLKD